MWNREFVWTIVVIGFFLLGACGGGTADPPCLDVDGDGYGDGAGCLGPDCDDSTTGVNPDAVEDCSNGVDDDCDGDIDDRDSYCTRCQNMSICDDGDPCTDDICHLDGCDHIPEQDGYPCMTGTPCIVDEVCQAGLCVGVAMVCDSPPPFECRGDSLLTYWAPGTCEDHVCSYEGDLVPCDFTCQDGACLDPSLGSIEFVSVVPDRLGIQGFGIDESAQVSFRVLDDQGLPFPAGQEVDFQVTDAPGVTLDAPLAVTDSQGAVSAVVSSGRVAASVVVTATVSKGGLVFAADSPSIFIVGVWPSARHLTFSCDRANQGGFLLDFVNSDCVVSLADRFSNPIGRSTTVSFQAEAGGISSSQLTAESGPEMGTATVVQRTQNPRPVDVPPLVDEPYVLDGGSTRNPRDGLVTLIAYVRGEEEFTDLNGNGDYDPGEPFVDLGEPFTDSDDDGLRGPVESFVDTNDNQSYDPPNGSWDADVQIWIPTWILWTGSPLLVPLGSCSGEASWSRMCPDGAFSIQKGASQEFSWWVTDPNLNPVNSSLLVDARVVGKGTLGLTVPALPFDSPERLGVPIALGKHDGLGTPCDPAQHPICYQAPTLGSWGPEGDMGVFTVYGAPVTDTSSPAPGDVHLDLVWQNDPGEAPTFEQAIVVSGTFQ